MTTLKLPPRGFPRVRVRPEFLAWVRQYQDENGLTLRRLVSKAFEDDSLGVYQGVSEILLGRALARSPVYRFRMGALMKATGWPADQLADEPVGEDR